MRWLFISALVVGLSGCQPSTDRLSFGSKNNELNKSSFVLFNDDNSCKGRCGDGVDSSKPCQCNSACVNFGDCCEDYEAECHNNDQTCAHRCGEHYNPANSCHCNDECQQHHNCCPDYGDVCNQSDVTTEDMIQLAETLISLDTDNVGHLITLEKGCTTDIGNTQDCSPKPLFQSVDEDTIKSRPIYRKFMDLMDNYQRSVREEEDRTAAERQEELDFLQAVMSTDVMRAAYEFLAEKGVFSGSYDDFGTKVDQLWFTMYSRSNSQGKLASSGFEHVFIGEINGDEVTGFHNWFSWYLQEKAGHINYLGYWREATFDSQMGGGIENTYFWDTKQKPYGSMFIGTSPALEMAIYTSCLLTFPDTEVHLKMTGQDVYIQTWSGRDPAGVDVVGSSYPDFGKKI